MIKHFSKHGMDNLNRNLNQAMIIQIRLQVNQTQHKLLMTRILWLALVNFCNYFKMAKQIRPNSFILYTVDLNREPSPQTLPN